jgi:MFS family permease
LSFLLILLISEKNRAAVKSKSKLELHHFPKEYWKYLWVTAIFGIGNSSNSFLILQIKDKGLSLTETVIVYAMFNLIAALISYPAGYLSDKFGRKPLLLIAFIIFILSYTGFAYNPGILFTEMLFVFYGLFQGIFRSVGKTFAADFVPQKLRASSIGWYSTVVGLSGLIASVVAGQLWDKVNHISVFIFAIVPSFIGMLMLLFLIPNKTHVPDPEH